MLRALFNSHMTLDRLIVMLISYVAVIMVVMPIHEWAHGFVASRLGDPTPRMYGRLTLNPFAHLDKFGTVMMLLFGFGFAKPVPIDPRYFRKPRTGMVLTALAGPASNLLVALAAAGICRLLWLVPAGSPALDLLYLFFICVAELSIYLAVFNLLPLPPLDGYRIISPLLPSKWTYYVNRYQQYATLAILVLLATDVLDKPLYFLSDVFYDAIFGVFGLI